MGVREGRNIQNPRCLPSFMKRPLAGVRSDIAVQTLNVIKTHCHRNIKSKARMQPCAQTDAGRSTCPFRTRKRERVGAEHHPRVAWDVALLLALPWSAPLSPVSDPSRQNQRGQDTFAHGLHRPSGEGVTNVIGSQRLHHVCATASVRSCQFCRQLFAAASPSPTRLQDLRCSYPNSMPRFQRCVHSPGLWWGLLVDVFPSPSRWSAAPACPCLAPLRSSVSCPQGLVPASPRQ